MNKEMIISSTPHETRVAILEDDQVVEIFIEREHSRGVVGNVYKGRVSKVLPGMQSAFVDLGLERDAFLYVTDVISPTEEALEDDEEIVPAALPEPAVELVAEAVAAADVEAGTLAEHHALDADGAQDTDHLEPDSNGHDAESDEDARNGTLMPVAETPAAPLTIEPSPAIASPPVSDQAAANGRQNNRGGDRRRPERQLPTTKIEDLLKERQEIVVQVVKEPLGTKGARITSHLSLPGRFLVYMPTVDHIGVSRKIESRDERRRLRTIVQRFREQSGLPGRRDHPDRGIEPVRGGHHGRPDLLPAGLERNPAEARNRAHARRAVP